MVSLKQLAIILTIFLPLTFGAGFASGYIWGEAAADAHR